MRVELELTYRNVWRRISSAIDASMRSTHLLDWPVFHLELLRLSRRWWPYVLRIAFAGFLVLQFVILWAENSRVLEQGRYLIRKPAYLEEIDIRFHQNAALTAWGQRYAATLLWQQLALLMLVTPALTAGALGYEKERDTLSALFGTQLTPWAIVTQKLIARLSVLAIPALATLPLFLFATQMGEWPVERVLVAVGQASFITTAFATASMLTSVLTRRTGDAILACYAVITLSYLAMHLFLENTLLPDWLDPFLFLQQLALPGAGPRPVAVCTHLAMCGAAAAVCLIIAAITLRPACARQLQQRPGRWLSAFRRPVGDDPIRWRECHVIGLAPLPWLRIVPTWLGRLGVFLFATALALQGMCFASRRGSLFSLLRGEYWGDIFQVSQLRSARLIEEVHIMGAVLLIVGSLVVAVRCATSVAEEYRRKTWEDLMLTPLSVDEIIEGKFAGILRAAMSYLALYAIPMFAMAAFGGASCLVVAIVWVIASTICIWFAARFGIASAGITSQKDDAGRDHDIIGRAIWAMQMGPEIWHADAEKPSYIPSPSWLAAEFRALPVYHDRNRILLLRPDGEVLELVQERDWTARPACTYLRHIALTHAAKRFPKLRPILFP